jgi:hypothetical protein
MNYKAFKEMRGITSPGPLATSKPQEEGVSGQAKPNLEEDKDRHRRGRRPKSEGGESPAGQPDPEGGAPPEEEAT